MKLSNKAMLSLMAVMLVTWNVQANSTTNANRFNSIKSGMSRTASVTAQTQSTPNSTDFNDAVKDVGDTYGRTYDDSDLKNRVIKLENERALKTYVDNRDASYYNSAKSYANSAASGAESRAKSHANSIASSRANTAESNAKGYANSIATSKANTAEANAKSYASSQASGAESRSKSHATSLVNGVKGSVSHNSSEIGKLWAAVRSLETGSGGGGGTYEWITLYNGAGTKSVSIPNKTFTHFKVKGQYRAGMMSPTNAEPTKVYYVDREEGSHASPLTISSELCFGSQGDHYKAVATVPVPKSGKALIAPPDATAASQGYCGSGGSAARGKIRDFKWTHVSILALK